MGCQVNYCDNVQRQCFHQTENKRKCGIGSQTALKALTTLDRRIFVPVEIFGCFGIIIGNHYRWRQNKDFIHKVGAI